MSVNQRLIILFIAIVVAFAGFFYLFVQIRQREASVYHDLDYSQRRATIEAVFDIKRSAQIKLVSDYSEWDEMYFYAFTHSRDWAQTNLSTLIPTFGYSLVQVYDRSRNLIYSATNNEALRADAFQFESAILDSVYNKRESFFGVKSKNLILATAAATIHRSDDTLRVREPAGYLFVSHTWDNRYLNDLAKSLNYQLKITSVEPTEEDVSSSQFNIKILRPILDWQGRPLSWLIFYSKNPQLNQLRLLGKQILFGTAGFLLIFLVMQYALLQYWITHPLKLISQSLNENNPSKISSLEKYKNEFSDVALLIEKFFAQKEDLLSEISERSLTESRLREIEEQTRKIFITSPEAIIVTDLKGNIITVNDETYSLFDVQDQILNADSKTNIFSFVWPESSAKMKQITDQLSHMSLIKGEELDLVTQKGKKFPSLISASVVYDSKREPNRLIFISRDLSEPKALEMKLRQAQKMESIGTLAGGIAHDFNNIITIISGYIALSIGKIEAHSKAQKDMDEALKACMRAKKLVSKILTFSRMSEKRIRPIQISSVIEDSLPMLRASIPSSIEIKSDISSDAFTNADPTEIQQILMNLSSNSYHAMRNNGGTLSIVLREIHGFELIGIHQEVQLSDDYIHLCLKDTGSGIPQELLERVFDPYFSTKPAGEGSGLGLSIVHGIISSYNGFITVQSKATEGTTMNIYLPVVEPGEELEEQTATIEYDFIPASILFVDDEETLAELFGEALREAGYEVDTYSDSHSALVSFSNDPTKYDLIIADVTMPRMDGLKLASLIRAQRQLPIILYTGFSDGRVHSEAARIGVCQILNKPLLPDDLIKIVKQVIAEAKV